MTASAQARLIDIPPLACKGTNPHVHLMYSDRLLDGIECALERMFSRYNAKQPELGGCRKDSGGLSPLELRANVLYMRKTIADLQNEALADSGHKARVDHRSLREQGKQRQPEATWGKYASAACPRTRRPPTSKPDHSVLASSVAGCCTMLFLL
jgi:hypothetical protein